MKATLLALTVAIGFAAGAAQEKDKKEDKAAKLAKAIDEIARAAESVGVKPFTEEQKKAAEPLQGTWSVSELVENEKSVPAADLKKWAVVIKGQIIVVLEDGELKANRAPIFIKGIDATKKLRELDLDVIVDDHARLTVCGIYAIEGKTLTVVLGGDSDAAKNDVRTKRPTTFETRKGDRTTVIVLKKVE